MKFEGKVRWLSALVLGGFLLVFLKLFFLQVIFAEKYAAAADEEHFYSLEIPASRGEIRSRDGFALVGNKTDFLFYANLSKLTEDKTAVAQKTAEILAAEVPQVSTNSAVLSPQDQEAFLTQTK